MSIVRPFPAPLGVAREPMGDEEPGADLYVYSQRRDGDSHAGVVCQVAMKAFADGRVRGHEAVQPDRVAALLQHHATTTDPPPLVSLLHRAGPAFEQAVDTTCLTQPIQDFAGPEGYEQTVWRVDDRHLAKCVTEELAAAVFYIADGHHRVAAALEEWRLAGKPDGCGLLCVVHPMTGLRLSALHRRVIGPVDPSELLGLLDPRFRVRGVREAPTPTPGTYGLYVGREWYDVRPLAEERGGRSPRLDAALLQTEVLDRLSQLTPGSSLSVEPVPARTRLDMLTQWCDAEAGALFTLAPPSLDVVTRLADAGEVMPPKTTYFEPKPCAGIFWPSPRADET